MPELPEVETVVCGIRPAIDGNKIKAVFQNRPDLRVPFPDHLKDRLEGQVVRTVRRRAKYILIDLSGGESLIIHLGMSGQLLIIPSAEKREDQKHDHLIVEFDDGARMIFNDPRRFGMVMMAETKDLENHPSLKGLGPEPLSDDFTPSILKERLAHKKGQIKPAMLDQHVVAGLGNIYICEALWLSGISPKRKSSTIKAVRSERLCGAVKDVLAAAIESGGSTLKDFAGSDGKPGYFQHNFEVYGREGAPCSRCQHEVQKIMQGGRSTFYCPECQR